MTVTPVVNVEPADWARDWYRPHGRPWTFERRVEGVEGLPFVSPRLEVAG